MKISQVAFFASEIYIFKHCHTAKPCDIFLVVKEENVANMSDGPGGSQSGG